MKQKTIQIFSGLSCFLLISVGVLLILGTALPVCAQEIPKEKKEIYSSSGLPIPRFVSLGRKITNVRAGPGQEYPIRWVYKKPGMPVEIILEYDHWRKIRDYEGDEGWVYKTLLSGKRTGIVIGDKIVPAYEKNPEKNSYIPMVSVKLEPMSMVDITSCNGKFCYIEVSNLSGWIERKSLWGVYESENFY